MSKIGKFFKNILLPVAEIAGSVFLGPEIGAGLEALGVGASTASALAPAVIPALAGGLTEGIKTGNPLKGLEGAALGGGAGFLGGQVGGALGDAITGAGLGAATSDFSGKGALLGGVAGGALGALSGAPLTGSSPISTPATGAAGGGSSAAATSLPGLAPSGATGDLTAAGGLTSAPIGGAAGDTIQGLTPSGSIGGDGALTAPGALAPPSVTAVGGELTPPPGWVPTDQAGTAGAASHGGIDSLFSKGSFLDRNSNLLLPVGALALSAGQQKAPPELKALEGQAATLGTQGADLMSYLNKGTLPPGAQAAVDQATQSAKAHTRQQFANMGLTNSPMEQQALAEIDRSAAGQMYSIASDLLSKGITESNLSTQLYQMILSDKRQNNADLSQALVEFAAAAQGSSTKSGTTINIGGAKGA